MKLLRLLFVPIFWIGTTYATINYGPEIIAQIQGKKQLAGNVVNNGEGLILENVLGESEVQNRSGIKLPSPPESAQQIPEYIQEIVRETTNQIVETGSTTINQTTQNVTENICQQIILEVQKQCGPQSTPEPTKSE